MAYTGGIEFIDDKFGQLDVCQNLNFVEEDRNALIADLWEIGNCHFKGDEEELGAISCRVLISLSGMEIGRIQYDVNNEQDLPLDGITIVGRSKAKGLDLYHVLILRRGVENEYQRVGVGVVQEGCISWQRSGIRIV
jgi:hypothetical protein